jgi:hypothetical protein
MVRLQGCRGAVQGAADNLLDLAGVQVYTRPKASHFCVYVVYAVMKEEKKKKKNLNK